MADDLTSLLPERKAFPSADPTIVQDTTRAAIQRESTKSSLVTEDKNIADREAPTVLDTAGAMFIRETIVGSILADAQFDGGSDAEPGYNPYTFYKQRKDELQDIEPQLRSGLFDQTRSSAQFLALTAKIRTEKENLRLIEQGSGWGVALGAGLSLLDVLTLVPFAAGGKTKLANAVRGAFSGAAVGIAQEGVLQNLQETRTAAESFLNIGVMGGLGLAIGPLAPLAKDPAAASKALDVNVPSKMAVITPGQATSEAHVIDDLVGTGAARVGGDETALATPSVFGALGKVPGLKWLGEKFISVSPVGRSFLWSSPIARSLTQRMVDLGGGFTRHMEAGIAQAASVEDVKLDFMLALHEGRDATREAWKDMAAELGAVSSRAAATIKGDLNLVGSIVGVQPASTGITEAEFQSVVRRKLTNDWWQQGGVWRIAPSDDQWFKKLLEDNKLDDEAAKVIEKHTDKAAKTWQRLILKQEDDMVRLGMITDEQRLGNKYGHAQLWNRANVNYDREGFYSFLLDVFAKRPDAEWLRETYGLTVEQFEKLPQKAVTEVAEDGTRKVTPGRTEILEEWVGDAEAAKLERVRAAYEEASRAYAEATAVKEWTDLGVKIGYEENARARYADIIASVRAHEAELAADRLELYGRRVQKLQGDVEHLRGRLEAGRKADSAAPKVIEGFEGVQNFAKRLDESVDVLGNSADPQVAQGVFDSILTQYDNAVERLAKAKAEFEAQMKIVGVKDPKKLEATLERINDKLTVTEAQLEERVAAIEQQERRLATLQSRLDKVRALRKEKYEQLQELRAGAKAANVDVKAAKRGLSAAERAKVKAEKKPPLLDTIERLRDAIADHKQAPLGILDNAIGESGRVKDRRIILTNEERRIAEERGFLHSDLEYIMSRQFEDVSARLALRQVLGDELRDLSKAEVWKAVEADYESRIKNAASDKLRNRLVAERDAVKADVEMIRDRLLGRAMLPDDPESFATWGMNKVRQQTYLRFAAGFPLSSLTDVSSGILHVGFGAASLQAAKKFYRILKNAGISPSDRELRLMATAAEMSMAHSTAGKQFLLNELPDELGIGARGSLKKTLTGAYDRVANTIASRMNTWTLMAPMNASMKSIAATVQVDQIRQLIGKYDSISKLDRARLASIGIGREEAGKLREMFERFGEVREDGFDPNSHLWHQAAGGEEAHRTLRLAISRTISRAVMTPGVGDAPLFMSKALGQILLQFQSYGFGSVNRILLPAMQRGLGYGDVKSLAWLSSLMGIATFVGAIRAYVNGKDPAEYDAMTWTKEIIDRGGLLAYMSPYVDALDKATGLPFGGAGVSSRYRNNNWWNSLLGPWYSTIEAEGQAVTAAANGDWDKVREKAFRLAPFNQWFRYGNAILDHAD